MTTSGAMGRPPIKGLTSLNLRLLRDTLDALDRIVDAERARRHDPGFTRTDLIREVLGGYAREHDPQKGAPQ